MQFILAFGQHDEFIATVRWNALDEVLDKRRAILLREIALFQRSKSIKYLVSKGDVRRVGNRHKKVSAQFEGSKNDQVTGNVFPNGQIKRDQESGAKSRIQARQWTRNKIIWPH